MSDAVRERVERAVRENAGSLLAFLQRRCGDPADAADALAETLLVVWRRRRSLPGPPEEARMWMFGIARNVVLTTRRSRWRRRAAVERLGEAVLLAQARAADDPARAAEFVEVRRAVDALPAAHAELIRLVHWDGFTIADAGRLLGISPSAARSRHAAALTSLRATLAVPTGD